MIRGYFVVKDKDGLRQLLAKGDPPLRENYEMKQFTMEQPEPNDERARFEQKNAAANHAQSLVGENVHWVFNGVRLETDMQHRGDMWAIYTEMNAELAN